jgi:hypothetical protein
LLLLIRTSTSVGADGKVCVEDKFTADGNSSGLELGKPEEMKRAKQHYNQQYDDQKESE